VVAKVFKFFVTALGVVAAILFVGGLIAAVIALSTHTCFLHVPFATWITVIGVTGSLFVGSAVLSTYISNSSLRKWELIKGIFDAFTRYNLYIFYERIKRQENIDFEENDKDDRLLNTSLTLFDALCYFHDQKLLDDNSWEYVASEIYNFALNNSVREYISSTIKRYQLKGFPYNIIPFTGFPPLVEKVLSLRDFKLRSPQLEQIEMWIKELKKSEKS
jgi:hypothetical protein